MKLNELQLEVMDRTRDGILNENAIFICLEIENVIAEMIDEEAEKLRYKAFFFRLRRNAIRKRLVKEGTELTRAISEAIYPHTTFSGWLLSKLEGKMVKFDAARHRRGRIAWLDRIIDTGEIN